MAEIFDVAVRTRAYNAAIKLRADQLEYLQTLLNGRPSTVAIEEAYEKQTGQLLEPVIARYWNDLKKIPTSYYSNNLSPVGSWRD